MERLLSLSMIVRNEEKVLARALSGVRDAVDEIVIADTGSTDGTVSVAESFGAKVVSFPWRDDFAAARNFSFSLATCHYVMWLDADDVVTEENAALLKKLRERLKNESPDTVMCRYDVAFDAAGRPTCSYIRERVLKREGCPPWHGRVHECIPPFGKIIFSHFTVKHGETPGKVRGERNLAIYRKAVSEGEELDARHLFYYGRELAAAKLYREAESVLREAISSSGWATGKIEASKTLADCLIALRREDEAMSVLLESFRFGSPRAAVCCKIGALFRKKDMPKEAIFWYKAALAAGDHSLEGDFEQPECRGVIPLVELTACYWRTGERDRAYKCHLAARDVAPEHPSVVYNDAFFRERGYPLL